MKHLFLWNYDKIMWNKLDEQANFSDNFCDIVAIVTCLQASINIDKSWESQKFLWFNQFKNKSSNMNINTLTLTKTESNHNKSVKSISQKNSSFANSNKNHKMSKEKLLYYECSKSDHIKLNCFIMKTE